MSAADYAHYDASRRQWGYWTQDGVWHPLDGNPAHAREGD